MGVGLALTAPAPLSGIDEILPAVAWGASSCWPSGLALLLLCSLLASSSLLHLYASCQSEIIADPWQSVMDQPLAHTRVKPAFTKGSVSVLLPTSK